MIIGLCFIIQEVKLYRNAREREKYVNIHIFYKEFYQVSIAINYDVLLHDSVLSI